jgi:hypothetical protein
MMPTKCVVVIFCVVSFSASAMDKKSGNNNAEAGRITINNTGIINIGPGNVYVSRGDLTVNQSPRMDIVKLVATNVVWPILVGIGSFGYQHIRENRQNGNGVTTKSIVTDWTLGRLCRSVPSMAARIWSILRVNVLTRDRATLFPWPPCPSDYVFEHQYAHLARPESNSAYQPSVLLSTVASTVSENTQNSMPPETYAAYLAEINREMSGQSEPSAPPADPVPGYDAVLAQSLSPYNQMFIPMSPRSLPPVHKKWQITTFESGGSGDVKLTFNRNQDEGIVSKGRIIQQIQDGCGSTYVHHQMNNVVLNLPGVRKIRLGAMGNITVDGIGEQDRKNAYDFSIESLGNGNVIVNPNHHNLYVKTLAINQRGLGDCNVKHLRGLDISVANMSNGNSYVRPESSFYGNIRGLGSIHCYIDHLKGSQWKNVKISVDGYAGNFKLHE